MKENIRFWLLPIGLLLGVIAMYFAQKVDLNLNNPSVIPGGHATIFIPSLWFLNWGFLVCIQLFFLTLRLTPKWRKYYGIEAMSRLNLLIFFIGILSSFYYLLAFSNPEYRKTELDFYWRTSKTYFFLFFFFIFIPFLFGIKKIRESIVWTLVICILCNLERILTFIILKLFW
jgi:hypothetical protein